MPLSAEHAHLDRLIDLIVEAMVREIKGAVQGGQGDHQRDMNLTKAAPASAASAKAAR